VCGIGASGVFELQATKLALIKAPVLFYKTPFFSSTPCSEERAMDVSPTYPNTLETSPCRPDVVIHLPTWTESILFIAATDSLYHLPLHHITKITQAIQWLQGVIHAAVAVGHLRGIVFYDLSGGHGVWSIGQSLLVPRYIRRWTGQTMTRISIECLYYVL
jgi:hypothetical protein